MDHFNALSQGGKKLVKYDELCTKWNKDVVSQLRSLDPSVNPATIFETVRFKTKSELRVYASKEKKTVIGIRVRVKVGSA